VYLALIEHGCPARRPTAVAGGRVFSSSCSCSRAALLSIEPLGRSGSGRALDEPAAREATPFFVVRSHFSSPRWK